MEYNFTYDNATTDKKGLRVLDSTIMFTDSTGTNIGPGKLTKSTRTDLDKITIVESSKSSKITSTVKMKSDQFCRMKTHPSVKLCQK